MRPIEAIKDIFTKDSKPQKPGEINFKKLKTVVDKFFDGDQAQKVRSDQDRFLKRFKGEWWDKDKLKDTESTVTANLFFSTVMTIAPLITDNRPIWGVRARKPYLQNYMEGFSLALEYLWDKADLDHKSFLWILDALIMKIGIMKCYYNPDSEFGGEVEYGIVDPRTFFCAPGYDDIWDSPMCGTRTRMPLSWIRMTYPDSGADVQPDDEKLSGEEQAWELDAKFATVYEVWLKDSTMEKYFIEEEGGEETKATGERKKYPYGRFVCFTKDTLLNDKPSIYKHGKPPYVALYDYPIPHDLVGMGEGDQIEEINKSFNRNLQLIDAWTRDYCDAPWLVDTNANLDFEIVKQQLMAGHAAFEVNMSISPDPIRKAKSSGLDQAVPVLMSMEQKLLEEVTGVTDVTKGMTSKSQRQSATEISTLVESAYTRTRQRVRNYEWSVKRLLHLSLSMMQQFYSEPRDFSMTSDNTVNYYTVGSSNAQARATIGTPNALQPQNQQGQPANPNEPDEDARVSADYERFIKEFGETDPVYADFDLEVQTNSSLPMDKQSLANLYLRLLEMAGGNPVTGMPMWEAVLQALRIPRYKEIIGKMEELFQRQTQPPAPPVQLPEGQGPPELMTLLQRASGGQQ